MKGVSGSVRGHPGRNNTCGFLGRACWCVRENAFMRRQENITGLCEGEKSEFQQCHGQREAGMAQG